MKVKDMIAELSKYHPGAEVIVTWESIFRDLGVDSIYLAPNGVLVIDADDNCYKDRILTGRLKPK